VLVHQNNCPQLNLARNSGRGFGWFLDGKHGEKKGSPVIDFEGRVESRKRIVQ